MDWTRDLPTWPRSDTSRQIRHAPHVWHVQDTGDGPLLLLLHGAGASTHSWRDLIPALARDHRVIALDLPGQGFTRAGGSRRLGLDQMAADIAALCQSEGWRPAALLGHSAGAAVALRLADHLSQPKPPAVIGINAALAPFSGIAGWMFPLLAKLLALNPLTALAFSVGPSPEVRARRLIESTGSTIPPEGIALYARLTGDRAHVDGTLRMMAQWDVRPLLTWLPEFQGQTLFLCGEADKAVPPSVALTAAARMPRAEAKILPRLGHLAHEEAPEAIADLILSFLAKSRTRA